MLLAAALEWWESIENSTKDGQPQVHTWMTFKDRFLRRYCPTDMQERYAQDFMELKQGKMTVTAYLTEFNKKSKFAVEMVPTEARRIKRFVDGLRFEIRENLDGRSFVTLDEVAEMARRREHLLSLKDAESMPAPKKSRFDSYSHHSASANQSRFHSSSGTHGHDAKFCRRCNRKHSGPCNRDSQSYNPSNNNRSADNAVRCYRCGKAGHFTNQCTQAGNVCYGCGSPGHIVRDCPQTTPAGSQALVVRPVNNVVVPKQAEPARARARAYQIVAEKARETPEVETGIFLSHDMPDHVLTDSGVTYLLVTSLIGC